MNNKSEKLIQDTLLHGHELDVEAKKEDSQLGEEPCALFVWV